MPEPLEWLTDDDITALQPFNAGFLTAAQKTRLCRQALEAIHLRTQLTTLREQLAACTRLSHYERLSPWPDCDPHSPSSPGPDR